MMSTNHRTSRHRRLILAGSALILMAAGLAAAGSAMAKPSTQKATGQVIADPGFSQFDGTFYVYGSIGRFPVRESAAWNGPYKVGDRGFLLGNEPGDGPRQEGTCGTYGNAHWGPQVFKTKNSAGQDQYDLYYSACHKKPGKKARTCVSIATATAPTGPFSTVTNPRCAPDHPDAEAIDASSVVRGGQRWMFYKTNRASTKYPKKYKIWALPMKPNGTQQMSATSKAVPILGSNELLEAPYVVNHGRYAWMFVSRSDFASCKYRTDVYRATTIKGDWKFAKTLLTSASTGICGPGGASVTAKDGQDYIAYHGYRTQKNGKGTGSRYAYVAKLGWNTKTGMPFVQ